MLLLTLGTGIGTALFVDGRLVPNTEFGHLQVAGREAEKRASGRAKVEQQLSWDAWAEELSLVFNEIHALLWPDLIVLCGGITEEPEKFMDKLHCEARLCVGTLRSEAGIVGAAFATRVSARALNRGGFCRRLGVADSGRLCGVIRPKPPRRESAAARHPQAPVGPAQGHGRSRHSMIDQPYRLGGAAPGGFDCSGLVAFAAAGAGIRVPRTAHEQLASGMPIARGELRRAIWSSCGWPRKELHVGIAIDKELFVHAPSTGGRVRIDSLAASPYATGFLKARRLVVAP